MLLRREQIISYHLVRLRLLQRDIVLLNILLHQILMQQLSRRSPLRRIVHEQDMISARNELGDIRLRPFGVDGRLLVDKFFDESFVRYHGRGAGAQFESVDAAILFGPFGKLEVRAFLGDLVDVS